MPCWDWVTAQESLSSSLRDELRMLGVRVLRSERRLGIARSVFPPPPATLTAQSWTTPSPDSSTVLSLFLAQAYTPATATPNSELVLHLLISSSLVPSCLRHNTTGFAGVRYHSPPPLDTYTPGTDTSWTIPSPDSSTVSSFFPQAYTRIHRAVPVALLPPESPGWPHLLILPIQAPYKAFGAMSSDYGKCIHASYKVHAPLIQVLRQVLSHPLFPTPSRRSKTYSRIRAPSRQQATLTLPFDHNGWRDPTGFLDRKSVV